ncbi:hypothetical protein ES288_A13G190800v1 [Gossypium darwinii]|uniref:Uncharacterized protein n=1 Tax=Gossypium darwinii TaxID=34276 RepID=A0A5D2E135_GOSDA|nr:hypothetical protein ES288_A13G190800v1 [Gossypium darwinii]
MGGFNPHLKCPKAMPSQPESSREESLPSLFGLDFDDGEGLQRTSPGRFRLEGKVNERGFRFGARGQEEPSLRRWTCRRGTWGVRR